MDIKESNGKEGNKKHGKPILTWRAKRKQACSRRERWRRMRPRVLRNFARKGARRLPIHVWADWEGQYLFRFVSKFKPRSSASLPAPPPPPAPSWFSAEPSAAERSSARAAHSPRLGAQGPGDRELRPGRPAGHGGKDAGRAFGAPSPPGSPGQGARGSWRLPRRRANPCRRVPPRVWCYLGDPWGGRGLGRERAKGGRLQENQVFD